MPPPTEATNPVGTQERPPKAHVSRPKPQLSCTHCRAKKLKCDRKRPCTNCMKLPLGSCVYVTRPPSNKKVGAGPSGSVADRSSAVQERVQRLEQLLVALARNSDSVNAHEADPASRKGSALAGALPTDDSSPSESATRSPGVILEDDETRFVGSSHWEAVLQDIAGLKNELDESLYPERHHHSPTYRSGYCGGPRLLFDIFPSTTMEELICSLPAKSTIDHLLNLFLREIDVPLLILHTPTFLDEYAAFIQDPHATSFAWLALLFAILSLALQIVLRAGGTVDGILLIEPACNSYTSKAAHCLILSDYAKLQPYTIEAMLLYLACEHYWMPDEHVRASMNFSLIVRLAIGAGYHRDPSHYQQLSIFQSEMRRRMWTHLVLTDLLFASKCGLPRHIDERQCDTSPPLNVHDDDLYPDMTEVPPARPETEQSQVGYLNYKLRLLSVFNPIVDVANSPRETSYANILALDQKLNEIVATRPPWLELPAKYQDLKAPPTVLNRMMDVDLIVQRARMVLHRRYLIPARTNPQFAFSRKACLKAALAALQHQRTLYEAAQKSEAGLASNWRFPALMGSDFLHAALIICLDIDYNLQQQQQQQQQRDGHPCSMATDDEENQAIGREACQLLAAAQPIWESMPLRSAEASKAAEILRIMSARVHGIRRVGGLSQAASDASSQGAALSHRQSSSAAARPSAPLMVSNPGVVSGAGGPSPPNALRFPLSQSLPDAPRIPGFAAAAANEGASAAQATGATGGFGLLPAVGALPGQQPAQDAAAEGPEAARPLGQTLLERPWEDFDWMQWDSQLLGNIPTFDWA